MKSAVCELFLMEGGARPEFYTIQFSNEKELKEWKQVIQSQIEHCKQNNLKCGEYLCVVYDCAQIVTCEIVIMLHIAEVRKYASGLDQPYMFTTLTISFLF